MSDSERERAAKIFGWTDAEKNIPDKEAIDISIPNELTGKPSTFRARKSDVRMPSKPGQNATLNAGRFAEDPSSEHTRPIQASFRDPVTGKVTAVPVSDADVNGYLDRNAGVKPVTMKPTMGVNSDSSLSTKQTKAINARDYSAFFTRKDDPAHPNSEHRATLEEAKADDRVKFGTNMPALRSKARYDKKARERLQSIYEKIRDGKMYLAYNDNVAMPVSKEGTTLTEGSNVKKFLDERKAGLPKSVKDFTQKKADDAVGRMPDDAGASDTVPQIGEGQKVVAYLKELFKEASNYSKGDINRAIASAVGVNKQNATVNDINYGIEQLKGVSESGKNTIKDYFKKIQAAAKPDSAAEGSDPNVFDRMEKPLTGTDDVYYRVLDASQKNASRLHHYVNSGYMYDRAKELQEAKKPDTEKTTNVSEKSRSNLINGLPNREHRFKDGWDFGRYGEEESRQKAIEKINVPEDFMIPAENLPKKYAGRPSEYIASLPEMKKKEVYFDTLSPEYQKKLIDAENKKRPPIPKPGDQLEASLTGVPISDNPNKYYDKDTMGGPSGEDVGAFSKAFSAAKTDAEKQEVADRFYHNYAPWIRSVVGDAVNRNSSNASTIDYTNKFSGNKMPRTFQYKQEIIGEIWPYIRKAVENYNPDKATDTGPGGYLSTTINGAVEDLKRKYGALSPAANDFKEAAKEVDRPGNNYTPEQRREAFVNEYAKMLAIKDKGFTGKRGEKRAQFDALPEKERADAIAAERGKAEKMLSGDTFDKLDDEVRTWKAVTSADSLDNSIDGSENGNNFASLIPDDYDPEAAVKRKTASDYNSEVSGRLLSYINKNHNDLLPGAKATFELGKVRPVQDDAKSDFDEPTMHVEDYDPDELGKYDKALRKAYEDIKKMHKAFGDYGFVDNNGIAKGDNDIYGELGNFYVDDDGNLAYRDKDGKARDINKLRGNAADVAEAILNASNSISKEPEALIEALNDYGPVSKRELEESVAAKYFHGNVAAMRRAVKNFLDWTQTSEAQDLIDTLGYRR